MRLRLILLPLLVVLAALWATWSCGTALEEEPGRAAPVEVEVAAPGEARPDESLLRVERVRAVTTESEPDAPVAPSEADEEPALDLVELVVTAVDADGRAVDGLHVTTGPRLTFQTSLVNGPPRSIEVPAERDGTGRAGVARDASGRSVVTSARYERIGVTAQSDAWIGTAVVQVAAEVERLPVKVVVEPAWRLIGRLVHDDGTPVAGARVFVSVPVPGTANRAPRRLEVTTSDVEGVFRTQRHAVPDTRLIEVYVMAGTVAGTPHRFEVAPGLTDDVELVIPRGTVVHGRCVDEQGEPLQGVRIRGIFPMTGEITFTGESGHFSLPVPGGGGGLIFFREGYVQTALRDLTGPPEGTDIGDVVLPVGGEIAGRLVEVDGSAIAGATVRVAEPWSGHAVGVVETDESASFRFAHVGAGSHYATVIARRATDPADGLLCAFRFDDLRAGQTDLTLTLPAGQWVELSVQSATDGTERPFEIGEFLLVRDDSSSYIATRRIYEVPGESRSRFQVQVPHPGEWRFELTLSRTGESAVERVRVTPETERVVLTPR